ncbi:phosphopentomutase [Candidatus Fermentibacteria bacterium]|nr:MAG: phosphopentomutase [Candidatus Fermentibacteria bacterium]
MEVPVKKAILIVLDGVGTGEMPDADSYGDRGSDTLGNTAEAVGGLNLPNLQKLGLGNIHRIKGVTPVNSPSASWGKMAEASAGKDSITGHWEMMGIISEVPMPTFPEGFPDSLIKEFEEAAGRPVIGNEVASGTEIIARLGEKQMRTGGLIVYTSADSVFQIAAHEKTVPVEELYSCCETARKMLQPPSFGVGRVIARPFEGVPGSFARTSGRKDFSLPPPGTTALDLMAEKGIPVAGVGKVDDLFAHRNIKAVHAGSNREEMDILLNMTRNSEGGFIFANLCDFDMKWGHRNDFRGFAAGLEEFDKWLPLMLAEITEDDILLITADHGNDPTTPSTDHSREYVPLLAYSPKKPCVDLGIRSTFSDISVTLAEFFELGGIFSGKGL